MLLAVLYASKRSKEFGLKEDDLIDGVLWVAPFAIIWRPALLLYFRVGSVRIQSHFHSLHLERAAWRFTAACWVRSSA